MTHTDVGPTQVIRLLTALNIPAISTRTLQCRQNETGMAFEKPSRMFLVMKSRQLYSMNFFIQYMLVVSPARFSGGDI